MILKRIVQRKREEVAELYRQGIRLPADYSGSRPVHPRGFRRALLEYRGVSIIAEIKKASPSKGLICADFDPVEIAVNYQKQGAQALSVLTDEEFFQGSLLYLMQAREVVSIPVLRKDFIIDKIQIEQAHIHGADAILLIAAILEQAQIAEFKGYAAELGMDSLVEVHDEHEVEKALAAGTDLVGINNRNLNDFKVDIKTTFRLRQLIPASIPVVSESGLATAADIELLQRNDVTAALIGETLMRAGTGSRLLADLRGDSPS